MDRTASALGLIGELTSAPTVTRAIGYDHHIQPLIQSGMTVQVLGPPAIFPGDREPSFAILATDPDRAARLAGEHHRLQDPAEDPRLIARYGERAVA